MIRWHDKAVILFWPILILAIGNTDKDMLDFKI